MELSRQNFLNSVLNCGPPSVLMECGQPYVSKIFARNLVTVMVVVDLNFSMKQQPENLSTSTIQEEPPMSNRSAPMLIIGSALSDGRFSCISGRVLLFWCLVQASQFDTLS